MFVGLSKNLVNGFRVAVGTNLSKRPSQKQIQKHEDTVFIQNCVRRVVMALVFHAHSHGICVSSHDTDKAGEIPQSKIDGQKLFDLAAEYQKRLNLYKDTGKITQQGKEKMLESIYLVEEYFESCSGSYPMDKVLSQWNDAAQSAKFFKKIFNLGWIAFLISAGGIFASLDSKHAIDPAWVCPGLITPFCIFLQIKFGRRSHRRAVEILDCIPKLISDPQVVLDEMRN